MDNRYDSLRLKTKMLAGKWATVSRPIRNVKRSILLKRCHVKLTGLGEHECQVQAHNTTHAWVCPLDETVLSRGCVMFKLRTIEIQVRHMYMPVCINAKIKSRLTYTHVHMHVGVQVYFR